MVPYAKWAPGPGDQAGLGLEDRQDWLVLPIFLTRDSSILEESNFRVALAALSEADPSGSAHERHEFNHWACGWFAIILIAPGGPAETAAADISAALADYPILDDEDLYLLEEEENQNSWENLDTRERIQLLNKLGIHWLRARCGHWYDADTNGRLGDYLRTP